MLKCKKGFTLVEVLISIVILAIISVALLLLFNQSFEGIINSGRKSKTIYEKERPVKQSSLVMVWVWV
jgi:prepilin-type N-terminal cleavage/methylation domain-containing protein